MPRSSRTRGLSLWCLVLLAAWVAPAWGAPPTANRGPLRLEVLGAARMVTGSMHLLQGRNGHSVLIDSGLFQGAKAHRRKNHDGVPKRALQAETLLVSHAHIDHSGMIPRLFKEGFRGKIFAPRGTALVLRTMLPDSGRIQRRKAEFKERKLKRRIANTERELEKVRLNPKRVGHGDPKLLEKSLPKEIARLQRERDNVAPLYSTEDVKAALAHIVEVDYGEQFEPVPGMTARFVDAGHTFGSASVIVDTEGTAGERRRIAFSGDLGRRNALLFNPPKPPKKADYLVMEGTNGDADHPPIRGLVRKLQRLVEQAQRRGGKLVIPAFSLGRTQELLYMLSLLSAQGKLSLPVYVDSPMSVELTKVFADNLDLLNGNVRHHAKEVARSPFEFPGLTMIDSVEESKALAQLEGPAVIISSAGMCNAGRIRHHLQNTIADPRNTLLFVGYQAEGTLGRYLLGLAERQTSDPSQDSPTVKINNRSHTVAATVAQLPAMHGHGDRTDLLNWVDGAGKQPRGIFLVHGEESRLESLGRELERRGCRVEIPSEGQVFDLD